MKINNFSHLHRNSSPNFSTAPCIIEPSDERPEELDDPCEEFTEIGQHDQEERDADNSVHDGGCAPVRRLRCYVTVTWKFEDKKKLNKPQIIKSINQIGKHQINNLELNLRILQNTTFDWTLQCIRFGRYQILDLVLYVTTNGEISNDESNNKLDQIANLFMNIHLDVNEQCKM